MIQRIDRIPAGQHVASMSGILVKYKWNALLELCKRCQVEIHSFEQKNKMIDDLISQLTDTKFKKILRLTKDNYIQPSLLDKFKENRKRVLKDNLLRKQ